MVQKKRSKLIVKTSEGSLIQLLPEIQTDAALDIQSPRPVANRAVTAALNQIEEGILDSNIVKVTESRPTAANSADLENESVIAWIQPSDNWSITIDTEASASGARMGQVPLCFGPGLSGSMTVNWGDGTIEEYTAETAYANEYPEHEYEEAGEYTIAIDCCRFGNLYIPNVLADEGNALGPDISANTLKSINSALPRIGGVFDCYSQTFIDGSFAGAWRAYSHLESIPEDLFANNPDASSFAGTFSVCTSLASIPEGLFASDAAAENFDSCFAMCTSLESIPENLFRNNAAAKNFRCCFIDCSSLETVPTGLFAFNEAAENFNQCFNRCLNLEDFTLEIESLGVSDCQYFSASGSGNRTVYVHANSETYSTFTAEAASSGLSVVPFELL